MSDLDTLWRAVEPWWTLLQDLADAGVLQEVQEGLASAMNGYPDRKNLQTCPWYAWVRFHREIAPLLVEVASTRQLGNQTAKFAEASRLLKPANPKPRKDLKWQDWYQRAAAAMVTVKAAMRAPLVSGSDREFLVGALSVIDQSGAPPEKIRTFTQSLEVASKALERMGLGRVLYGQVLLVNQLDRKENKVAWYDIARDTLWIRAGSRYDDLVIQVYVHEFGHRWWRRFANDADKKAWMGHHYQMMNQDLDVASPEPGDRVPVKVPGFRGDPVLLSWNPPRLQAGDKVYPVNPVSLLKVVRENARILSFPTPYCRTDAEEHFCDALGLYAVGDLKEPHLTALKTLMRIR